MTQFKSDFTWGVATSSYQIEGATSADGRGSSIWDTFSHTPGKVLGGDTGDVACDHYHLWEQDLDLIADLGVDAYRFSVAWPRILPSGRGEVNRKGLDFYDRLVDGLLERNLQPFCTLYHWDLPQTLEDEGGWLNRDTALAFADYADILTQRLGDRVRAYATLNEPWCSAYLGYGNGHHAPGKQDLALSLQAAHILMLAHGLAVPLMRRNAPKAPQGIVLNLAQIYPSGYPEDSSPQDIEAAARQDAVTNLWYLDPLLKGRYPEAVLSAFEQAGQAPGVADGDLETIAAPLDYLGLNYYTPSFVAHDPAAPYPHVRHLAREDRPKTQMGWEIYPDGLKDMLLRLWRDYRLPLYVTENGAAFEDALKGGVVADEPRRSYFEGHLGAVEEAMRQGAEVQGYFAWSLMDNFEWAFGYARRFGIVHVDFETQKRTLKNSALWLKDFIGEQKRHAKALNAG